MVFRPIAAALAALPLLAFAQTGPIPITPEPPVESPPAQPAQVQVQELASVDPNESGLLDEAQGALGTGLWSGSTLALVARTLPMLPNQPGWRSLRALEVRLLESPATLPLGKPGGEPVIGLRAGKLVAMGEAAGAAALLSRMPSPAMTGTLKRLQIDSAFLAGDSAAACSQDGALRALSPEDNYAAQIQVSCQFLAGKGSAAVLGVDVLREQKLHDPVFFAAADALSGLPPARLDGLSAALPADIALVNAAKLPLPDNAAVTAPPALLPAVARAVGAPLETRIVAAEKAVAGGIALPELLRQLYDQVPDAASDKESGKTAKSRALLYKAANAEVDPRLKAELIQRGLAGEPGSAPLAYAAILANLQPSPDLVTFAPWAIRAAFAAGKTGAVEPWLGLLRAEQLATGNTALASLKPLARLAGLGETLTSADLAAWRQARNESPAEAAKHGLFLLCLLAALGDTPPESDWLPLLDGNPVIGGKVTRSALAVGLLNAMTQQRRGETAVYVLLSLGEIRDVEPGEFARLVAALRSVGLTSDARALAVELALAYGL